MKAKYGATIAFLDLLFNMLLVFVAMFLMAILLINPPDPEANIEQQVEYVIIIRWDPDTVHDIDLWLTDGKETVGFKNRQGSNFFLTRDDIGADAMSTILGYSINEETISILGGIPGKYTANVHLYSVRGELPIRVSWILMRAKGAVRIANGEVYLTTPKEEATLVNFVILNDGRIDSIDTETRRPFLTNYVRRNQGGP
jgi:hypothetical protein